MNAIGVDVGGTKIAAGVVTPEGELRGEVRYPSAGSSEKLLENIARAVREVREGHEDVGAVCLAVPGFVLARENRVVFSPNLPTIQGIRLKEELEGCCGLPVTVENDGTRCPSRDLVEVKEATLGTKSGVLGAAARTRHPKTGEYVLGA